MIVKIVIGLLQTEKCQLTKPPLDIATKMFMTSTHSQKVLEMLNNKLLETFEKYYSNLEVGDMSPEEFIKTYGPIEDRVDGNLDNGNLKRGNTALDESTSTFSINSDKADCSSSSPNDSQNVA